MTIVSVFQDFGIAFPSNPFTIRRYVGGNIDMALKVIGSGFGRTGTKSIKDALEFLGFGPCHHMYEIVENLDQLPSWQALVKGQRRDLENIFEGYTSQVDWPGAHFWQQSMTAFPDAKVLHSVRPPEKWWASFDKTIGKLLDTYPSMDIPPPMRELLDMSRDFIGAQTFGGNYRDREAAIAAFEQRTADVRATVPSERLLVFDVAEGWEPLCAFLGVAVPDVPFPHHNLRADFWEVLGGEPT
ncbi:sulfotransferase family protein [Tateyamaria pelophila]|uniref:sulfotransferase family protein n=1 Tax=Tateyamaria pelophila TaxID=328415 RepID=UPI001CBCB630|nr:sulfotransferase family protein [Tateyamaria pelophila]